jgi:unsaturated rhamnogalacturonyl hydrolase
MPATRDRSAPDTEIAAPPNDARNSQLSQTRQKVYKNVVHYDESQFYSVKSEAVMKKTGNLLIATVVVCCFAHASQPAPIAQANTKTASPDWSRAVVESTMKRYQNPTALGSWAYAKALFLIGEYMVWKRTGDDRYLQYVKGWVDSHVDAQGNLDHNLESLDAMLPGNLLLLLYQETKEEKYKLAASKIRQRFDTYPRTADGGFWHATGVSRQHQLWGDGVFMSMPFLVRYGRLFGESAYANDEAAKQLIVYASHLHSPEGLLYHAYDESGASTWANPDSRHSPEFWCRAMGWFGMTLIDVLDVLPANHPKRPQLIAIVKDLVRGLAKYQDNKTGLWYQVVDKGSDPANWLETSSSSMYSYVIAMAVKRGYVSTSYESAAKKGYSGVLTKISLDTDGLTNLADICEGTNVGDVAFYFARKRNVNDFHGLGAFLIMNEAFLTGDSAMQLTDPRRSTVKLAAKDSNNSNGLKAIAFRGAPGISGAVADSPAPAAVKYFPSSEVHASFDKGSPLINKDGQRYWVITGKRDKPGQSELHEKDTDVFYILQGSATFVTGGKMLEPKTTAPGEVRGSGIDGGEVRTLSKDDVIIIPAGVPHWFKDVQGTFLYFVVKVE